jgi:hypothetical protein
MQNLPAKLLLSLRHIPKKRRRAKRLLPAPRVLHNAPPTFEETRTRFHFAIVDR